MNRCRLGVLGWSIGSLLGSRLGSLWLCLWRRWGRRCRMRRCSCGYLVCLFFVGLVGCLSRGRLLFGLWWFFVCGGLGHRRWRTFSVGGCDFFCGRKVSVLLLVLVEVAGLF